MSGYICFYKDKRYEVYADTSYQAQLACAKTYRIKDSHRITVCLAEKGGQTVIHNGSELP